MNLLKVKWIINKDSSLTLGMTSIFRLIWEGKTIRLSESPYLPLYKK
jgi:hypothetical protein